MVFGSPANEHIQLNEDTYWTGGPYSSVLKGGYKYLPEVRQLVFDGKFKEAQSLLILPHFIKKGGSFFFNTFCGIQVQSSAPGLPVNTHNFTCLGFYPLVEAKFKVWIF